MPALPNIPPVISVAELRALLDKPSPNSSRVILLDVSVALPPHSEYTQYLEGRLPGARFFSIKRWAGQPYDASKEAGQGKLQNAPSAIFSLVLDLYFNICFIIICRRASEYRSPRTTQRNASQPGQVLRRDAIFGDQERRSYRLL